MPGLDGRRPKPAALQELLGNPGHKAHRSGEPQPKGGAPDKPAYLGGYASEEWDRIIPLLEEMKLLTIVDAPTIEMIVTAYQQYRETSELIAEHGYTYETETKSGSSIVRPRPEVAMCADAQRRYLTGLSHCGLTPATRTKVNVRNDDPKQGLLFEFQRRSA